MKKSLIFGFVALLGFGLMFTQSAYTSKKESKVFAEYWFTFDGSTYTQVDEVNIPNICDQPTGTLAELCAIRLSDSEVVPSGTGLQPNQDIKDDPMSAPVKRFEEPQ